MPSLKLERQPLTPSLAGIRGNVARIYDALLWAEEQLEKREPDLHLLESELQIAGRELRSACQQVDTEISRSGAGR